MFCGGESKDGDLAKHMENLTKGITTIGESVKNVDAKLEDVKRENAELKAKLEAKTGDEDPVNDELEDLLEDPKEQALRMKREIKTELQTEGALKAEQDRWDSLAYKEFNQPDSNLNDTTSRFYKEVKTEINTMFPVGYDKNRKPVYAPDAVYNAASRVKIRGQKEGWIALTIPREEDFEEEGTFPRRSIKGKQMTDIQRDLCKMWKVDEKKVETRIKGR